VAEEGNRAEFELADVVVPAMIALVEDGRARGKTAQADKSICMDTSAS
jgi:hypothetical protein